MKATIKVNVNDTISKIDDRLYSSFIEHMGRAVYTGIYEPGHPQADDAGFRQDVLELIQPLNLANIRYPGGNFVSGYRWEDGVGDRALRPVRRELAWASIESNEVGTNEFMDFCKEADTAPMMAVNLGTRGPQDAANLVEYCNVSSGSYYSDLRRSHGYEEPHNIKLWCLGNEMDGPWQICSKTAEEYGRIACETAKMMKWMDPSIELVACGSSFRGMPTFGTWERTVLRHCYEHVDYLSLHQYYQNNDGDLPTFLARNVEMDGFIKEVGAICKEIQAEKQSEKSIYLSFDEWNIWYHYQKEGNIAPTWIPARPIEEELFDTADALLLGSIMTTLLNNSDVVKIACLAQLVNVIAPIMTEPSGAAWAQTIYYPFLYTSKYGRGTALTTNIDCPSYSCQVGDEISYLDIASVLSEDEKTLTFFIVNKNLTESMTASFELEGCNVDSVLQWVTLHNGDLTASNTKDHNSLLPETVSCEEAFQNGVFAPTLQPASWNMIQVQVSK